MQAHQWHGPDTHAHTSRTKRPESNERFQVGTPDGGNEGDEQHKKSERAGDGKGQERGAQTRRRGTNEQYETVNSRLEGKEGVAVPLART